MAVFGKSFPTLSLQFLPFSPHRDGVWKSCSSEMIDDSSKLSFSLMTGRSMRVFVNISGRLISSNLEV